MRLPCSIMRIVRSFCAMLICALAFSAMGARLGQPLVFTGMCDASAAVALDRDLFVTAGDEDNILRFYRLSRPGKPLQTCNLNPLLFQRKKSPEMDIEGAARLGQRVFWITSHGRNAKGDFIPNRYRFFALELAERNGEVVVQPVGSVYTNLLADLSGEAKLAHFQLAEAAKLPPKAPGSLNIEALTDTPGQQLLIGFRNPIPGGRALIVPLLNPHQLLTNQPARFGDPILLDLGGLGLRGIGSTQTGYYLLAGPRDGEGQCRLFTWAGGASAPQLVSGIDLAGVSPEGVCFHDAGPENELVILSDDGTRPLHGKPCKDLPEPERQFRAFRLTR